MSHVPPAAERLNGLLQGFGNGELPGWHDRPNALESAGHRREHALRQGARALLGIPSPVSGIGSRIASYCQPELRVRARHLRGGESLRHAALTALL